MFNSSTLPPNTPPTMSRSQKEQDAASSLLELQQNFSNNNNVQHNSGMNSPASSPTESNHPLTTDNHINSKEQSNASVSISPSSQQILNSGRYELIMLPSIYRQRESAVRSTLSRSLPVFGTLVREGDEELCRRSAIHSDRHLQKEQAQLPPRKQLKPPHARYHSVYQIQRPQQDSSSQLHHLQSHQVTQAHAHAHAQAYYLAHARIQTYGYPQQEQQPDQSVSHCKFQEQQSTRDKHLHQQHHKKQPQQQHQSVMNHHVRAVEDRRSSQPWPEPNSNSNRNTLNANDQTSMQNSFSVRGNGVHIQCSILREDQQPVTPIPSHQNHIVGGSSPQQTNHHHHQQQFAAAQYREAHMQAAQHNIGQKGISYSKLPLSPVVFYHPMDYSKIHSSNYIAQQVHNQRKAIQQQAYRQHQQAHEQAIQRANQHIKQQQQQQHQHPPHQQTNLQHHQQAMHQHKETFRQSSELMAQNESLPHRQPQAPQQQQQERAIAISPSTASETVSTTKADEDEEMHELEDDEEEDGDYYEEDDSDPDFQSFSKSTKHTGNSSNASNHHHGNSNNNNKKKKGKSVKEKPRWTPQIRKSLLKAVITYKNLDDMTSFHWSQIGKQVGRSGKACKDQWRRALLPKIQQTFDRYDQDFNINAPDSSSLPASLQPQPQRNNKQ